MAAPDMLSGERLKARIEALAALTDLPGELTRLTLGAAHGNAAKLVAGWMTEAGLAARLDAAGNVVGRLAAADATASTLLLGSHIDTVRNAGAYDGNLGVILAIAVADDLQRRHLALPFALEVIAFADEEGVRFGSTLTGSRALAGTFDPAALDDRDDDGVTRREALEAFGGAPEAIGGEAREPSRTLGYVEVHIEQGPVLEAAGVPLGVVTAISGATRGLVTVEGVAGHAGTLPMQMRRDALAAAAEMVVAVEALARARSDVVATVGDIHVPGGAANTVAGAVRFTLDVRSPSDESRRAAVRDIETDLARIATARDVAFSLDLTHDMPAAPCDTNLAAGLAAAVARAGHRVVELPSGAGHDAMAFRGRIPMAMLLVRCRGGISHNPAEHCAPADMEAAGRVLFDFMTHLDAGQSQVHRHPRTSEARSEDPGPHHLGPSGQARG